MGGDVIEEQCDDIKLQAPLDVDISIVKKKWRFWGWRAVGSMCAVGAGIVLVAIYSPRLLREKNNKHAVQMIPFDDENSGPNAKGDDKLRIPLIEVVRFKEKQWFVEELEGARDGDANAMLRLAKMYLHGQGCEKSMPMAQEWLRKARLLGVFGTLEELYAGDDWQAEKARAAAAMRRSLKGTQAVMLAPSVGFS